MREKEKAFSLIQNILNRFPSIPSSQLPHLLFLSLRSTYPLLLFRKKQDSKRQPPYLTKQDIIRQGKILSCWGWTRQPNRRKRMPGWGKRVRDTFTSNVSPMETPIIISDDSEKLYLRTENEIPWESVVVC